MTVIRIFNRNYLSWQLPQGRWQMPGQKPESDTGLYVGNWHLCARPLLISLSEKSLKTQESVLHRKVHVCFCEHLSFCLWTIIPPILLTSHFCPVTHLHAYFTLAFFCNPLTILLGLSCSSLSVSYLSCLCTLCSINVSMLTSNTRRRVLRLPK